MERSRCARIWASIWIVAAILALRVPTYGREATALITKERSSHDGLWLSHLPSRAMKKIWSANVSNPHFTFDGKKIAFRDGRKIQTINNDGTELQTLFEFAEGDVRLMRYSSNGVIYMRRGADTGGKVLIKRFLPETGNHQTIADMGDIGSGCRDGAPTGTPWFGKLWCSTDGLRAWGGNMNPHTGTSFSRPMADIYCGCRDYNRSGKAFINWAPDFSRYDLMWDSEWGHGDVMTGGGHLVLVQYGGHRTLGVWQQQGTHMNVVHPFPSLDPPYAQGMEARAYSYCTNNDSLLVSWAYYISKDKPHDFIQWHLWNWRTRQHHGTFTGLDSLGPRYPGTYFGTYSGMTCVWDGPLPNPHSVSPYVRLDKAGVSFVVESGAAPAAQTVTVSNAGSTTLEKVGVSISPAAVWLTVIVEGNGGNAQPISNAVNPALLTQDQAQTTVTVSGGGASNQIAYSVSVYRGAALPPPSDLTVAAHGDSLLDAKLSWTDNAGDESGYIVERRKGENGTWGEVARTASNVTGYVDGPLEYHTVYDYRVKAFRQSAGGLPGQVSDPSISAGVEIVGIPWIRVHAPQSGQTVQKGTTVAIGWTTNRIDQVYLEYSLDDGEDWKSITPQGSIFSNASVWGAYPWVVPDIEAQGVFVKVSAYNETLEGISAAFAIGSVATINAGNQLAINGKIYEFVPGSGHLRVMVHAPDAYHVRVFSLAGLLLADVRGSGPTTRHIDLSTLSPNLYILSASVGGERFTQRFLVGK